MDCSEVLGLLSPLHDGELTADLKESVEEHLRECSACATVRADIAAISDLARQDSTPEAPDHLWPIIESSLEAEAEKSTLTVEGMPPVARPQWGRLTVAIALLFTAALVFVFQPDVEDEEHLVVNFDQFLTAFPESAEKAQDVLLTNYPSELTDLGDATAQIKYRPAIANKLPDGYTLDSLYLVRMPCCLCVEALCTTPDGQRLAILEHEIDQPVWFGDRPAERRECNGRLARLVRFSDRYAATWQSEDRFVTIIGIRDEEELAQLMLFLDPQEA